MSDKFEYIVQSSSDLITLINRDYVYEIANDAFCKAIEKPRQQIVGSKVSDVVGADTFESIIAKHLDACFNGAEVQYVERFKVGAFEKDMHVTYSPYRNGEGTVTHAVVCSRDVTHVSQIESKLSHFEFRDPTIGRLYAKRTTVGSTQDCGSRNVLPTS